MEWQCRRIKAARAMRNKSAQQVADEIQISLTQYKRGESNARRWTPGELLVIARFLEVPDAWLLHEDFDPFESGDDTLARIEEKLDALTGAPAQSTAEQGARTSPDILARKDILDRGARPVRSAESQSSATHQEDHPESQG